MRRLVLCALFHLCALALASAKEGVNVSMVPPSPPAHEGEQLLVVMMIPDWALTLMQGGLQCVAAKAAASARCCQASLT